MTDGPADDLIEALADVGAERRRKIQRIGANYRDTSVKLGEHKVAAFWQGIVLAAANVDDEQRDLLAALDDAPNVAVIVPEDSDDSVGRQSK